MWHLVTIIIGIIGLLHYLNPSKSHWQDKNQNKAWRAVPEAMMSNSNVIHDLYDYYTHVKPFHESHARTNLSEARTDKPEKWRVKKPNEEKVMCYYTYPHALNASKLRNWTIMGDVMVALTDPNIHLIGIYGSDDAVKNSLLQKVYRRIQRDQLFDKVVKVSVTKYDVVKNALLQKVYRRIQRDQLFGKVVTSSVTKYLDVRKIQDDIARQLGFSFHHKSNVKRANELNRNIQNKQNMLIVLCDLYQGLDLDKVGIPYDANHTGNKILLTSTVEDVLSNHMHTQINFKA